MMCESQTQRAQLSVGGSEMEANTSFEPVEIFFRNVVCNYTLPLHIDLRRIANNSGNAVYDRSRGFVMKQLRNPACHVKVYSSGKVYIVGCKSEEEAKRAARRVARQVQRHMNKLQNVVRIRNYKICNVLATCKMPFGIKVEELAAKYKQAHYEPELFVGLTWKFDDPKGTLRIHTTGSISVTGATSEAAVRELIELISPIVREFQCNSRYKPGNESDDELNENSYAHATNRKRAVKTHRPPADMMPVKRARPASHKMNDTNTSRTGIYGDKAYFSDEEDIY
jgi:transcription initiation factor TFIID TATA-box-binding protein